MILKKNKKGQVVVFVRGQLIQLIKKTIEKEGLNCDLNFLDISRITNLSYLFSYTYLYDFNGDISKWNTENVRDMSGLFMNSKFNGDISNWNTENVTDMSWMFNDSKFNGGISEWNTGNVEDMSYMFYDSQFSGDISNWNTKNVENTSFMFKYSPLDENPPSWY